MRIAFAGTPDFAAEALHALVQANFEVLLVLTQPDRPAGRGMKLANSPVKQLAINLGIPVHQPISLRDRESQMPLAAAQIDVLVVAAYGLILPPVILGLPKLG